MYKALNPGMVGVSAPTLDDAIEAAESALFHAVEFDPCEILNVPAEDVIQKFQAAKMRPAAWGLPALWRGTAEENAKVLAELPALAAKCSDIDCKRVYTWIGPASDTLTFEENWKWHVDTLTPIAQILAEHDCRLGLEYVGPKTSRAGRKYEFVHDMKGMLELCDAIGPNVGLMLDSWHWYTSHETLDQLKALTNQQAVHCHVNDAPLGIEVDEQSDGKRELPGATGVIDIAGFLNALKSFGYDGPLTPEPFNQALRDMESDEDRLEAVGYAMDKIWKLAGFN